MGHAASKRAPAPPQPPPTSGALQEAGRWISSRTLAVPPKAYTDFLRATVDRSVVAVQVCREPMNDAYQAGWQFVGAAPDRVLHVFLRVWLDNGDVWLLEKNRRIAITRETASNTLVRAASSAACAPIYRLPRPKPVSEFMRAAERQFVRDHGSLEWYFRYSALRYNCQQWLWNLVSANYVPYSPHFIVQRVASAGTDGAVDDVLQAATDVAALGEWLRTDVVRRE